jgi:hypothetical protein
MNSHDNPSYEEQTRRNPEFSLGERMATMEAKLAAIDENLKERKAEQKELFGEQIKSVREDIGVKDKAQKDAVNKAETTATSTASALATELRQYREATDGRLGAIERGGAGVTGEKQGTVDSVAQALALRAAETAQKANQWAMLGGGIVAIGVIVAIIKALGG